MKRFSQTAVFLLAMVVATNAFGAKAGSSNKGSFWLGGAIDNVHGGPSSSAFPSLSALMMMGDKSALQFYLGIASITPAFTFGAGANFKHSIVGDAIKGFHIGGGVGMGTTASVFFINFQPTLGMHFEIQENVMLNLDSGLSFFLIPGGATVFNLALGGNSPFLGLSLLMAL